MTFSGDRPRSGVSGRSSPMVPSLRGRLRFFCIDGGKFLFPKFATRPRFVRMAYRIELDKENFKFSSSHFTIFGEGKAERLHGHNYYTSCEITIDSLEPSLGLAFDFNVVKPLIREITESLDEFVLIPERSPFLTIEKLPGDNVTGSEAISVRVRFGAKEYVLPLEDVRLLPLVNITAEELARHIGERLLERLKTVPSALARIREIQIGVQESRGQTVFYQTRP